MQRDFGILTQMIYLFVYILGSGLIGLAISSLLIRADNKISMPILSKLCFGVALTPFVIGMLTLIESLIPVKLPNVVYLLLIYFLAVIILCINRKTILMLISELNTKICISNKKLIPGITLGIVFTFFYLFSLYVSSLDKVGIAFWIVNTCFLFLINVLLLLIDKKIGLNSAANPVKLSAISGLLYISIFGKEFLASIVNNLAFLTTQGFHVSDIDSNAILGIELVMILFTVLLLKLVLCKNESSILSKKECNVVSFSTLLLAIYFIVDKFVFSLDNRNVSIAYGGSVFVTVAVCSFLYYYERKMSSNLLIKTIRNILIFTEIYIVYYIVKCSIVPIYGSDATEYLSNALYFAKSMQISDLNTFMGLKGGVLLPITHHPGWVTYIANALLHTGKQLGFPNDFVARYAIQINLVYLIFASLGIGLLFNNKWVSRLCVTIPFIYHTLSIILFSASRDAFRMIPLIFLIALLVSIDRSLGGKGKASIASLLCIMFACMFTMIGHPINAITLFSVFLAFVVYSLWRKTPIFHLLKICFIGIVGAVFGTFQMFAAIIFTGTPTGGKADIESILNDTPYIDNYLEFTSGKLQGTETYWERLLKLFASDGGVLAAISIIIAVFLLVKIIAKRKENDEKAFLALIIIIQSFMFIDFFSWDGITFTKWCVMNVRYTLQMYWIYGLFFAIILGLSMNSLFVNVKWRKAWYGLILVSSLPAIVFILQWEGRYRANKFNVILNSYHITQDYQDENDKKILIDNYYCNYYLNDEAVSIFTEEAISIREAYTKPMLYCSLHEKDIGAILIMDYLHDAYWSNTVLEDYVNDPHYVKKKIKSDIFTLYILVDDE